MPLAVFLNGKPRVFPDLTPLATLSVLIRDMALMSDRVAVELNGEIVARAKWDQTALEDNDRLEVVHFVGGGSGSVSCPTCLPHTIFRNSS